ncbi:MAG: tetratricopeptide repeat protein [Pyrinomonadaceae bacterium]
MTKEFQPFGRIAAATALWTLLFGGTVSNAQDLVPVSDITGGSSVFVFRGSARPSPKHIAVKARSTTSHLQRIETARKVSTQYVALAQTKPRRARTEAVVPDDPRLPAIPTMSREQASKLFAGVGEYYMDKTDFDHAITFFRESSDLDNANAVAKGGLSEALAFKGNELLVKDTAEAARPMFEESLRLNPNNSPAYYGLGEVMSDLGKSSEAIENYEKARKANPDLTEILVPLGVLYYQQGEIAKADTLLTKAVIDQPADAQAQYYLGMVRFSQNKNPEALAAFQKAESLDAKLADAPFQAGETLVRLKRDAEAVAEYNKATALRDNFFEAWYGLGVAQSELENYPDAVTAFKKATRLQNTNIDAYLNLGDAYRQVGNYNDAEASYNLATTFIDRVPNYSKDEAADTYSKIGFSIAKQCEINMRKAVPCRWEAAVRAMEKAAALSQNNVDYANLGWAYYNAAKADINNKRPADARPKLEKAKENLQKAAFSSPKFIEGPLMNLGMTLTDLGDYPGAVDAFTRVITKKPEWIFALNELGIAYRKMNNYPAAAEQFKKAIAKDNKYSIAHYNLAETQFQAGNIGDAKKEYETLKKLGRNDLAGQLELISNGAVRR